MDRLRPILLTIFIGTILPHFFEVPLWVSAILVISGICQLFIIRGWIQPLRPLLLNIAIVASSALLFFQFRTILTPDVATPLLLMLAGFKLQEIRRPRDTVSFLFICTLSVMAYLLYSQSLLATLYMFVMVLAITLGFLVIHSPPNRVTEILKSSPKLVAKDTLLALPVFLLFFFLFPRFSTGWGQSIEGGQTSIGFSDSFNPGELAKLAKSNEPAFRVKFNGRPPLPKDLYWRGLVFDKTDGWNWTRHHNRDVVPTAAATRPNVVYEVTLEPKHRDALFVLQDTANVEWISGGDGNRISKFGDGIFSARWANQTRVQYRGETESDAAKSDLDSDDVDFYTHLPRHFSPQARALAEQLTHDKVSLQDKMMAIYAFYSQNKFQYSLSAPEMKTVDDFLFHQKIGFCEHYAGSFALLMRAAGIPARVVVGFTGGEVNTYGNFWLIRDSNAHAWVELYDKEIHQWRRTDPTQAVAGDQINLGVGDSVAHKDNAFVAAFYSAQMFWDSVNNRYTNMVMSYDFNEQKHLLSFKGLDAKRWQLLLITLLALAFVIYAIRTWMLRSILGPQSKADKLFARLESRLRKHEIVREKNEGPLHFAHRAAGLLGDRSHEVRQLMDLYILWEYGSQTPSDKDAKLFVALLKMI
jgi:transglutaminase-like putative cysteine protease